MLMMNQNTFVEILSSKQAELSKAQSKVVELQQEIADLEAAVKVLAKYAALVSPQADASVKNAAVRTLHRTITKREQILSIAHAEVLEKQPILTDVLLEMILSKGVTISGGDKKAQLANLSAYLSRGKEELGIEPSRHGWILSSKKAKAP
jgi:hypothetical protein